MSSISKMEHATDTSVLRRLLFATSILPADVPDLWEIVAKFAVAKSNASILPEQARVIADNITYTDEHVLMPEDELFVELAMMSFKSKEHIGVNLISKKQRCIECEGNLLLRRNRPSKMTIYTDTYGTLPCYQYRKYCSNHRRGCHVVQHYGYYTKDISELYFDSDWDTHKYFVSSQETAFELQLLTRFDFELLIGQISYKQRAEIYNAVHGYSSTKKQCSLQEDGTDTDESADYLGNV